MKKIININLSGRVIPIEDSAYEKLQNYIESLRKYFMNEEGRDEIINDIESRVAELMSEQIRKGAEAVNDSDIEEIISSMGRVEDFEAEEKAAAESVTDSTARNQHSYSDPSAKREKRRLYRDSSDKFIGGVCSGIAHYLNIDPSIIRILFAIITFGGFSLGILGYIILWIVLPPKEHEGFAGKRLYRNPDDRVFGGVAGGLAAYFGRNPRTIRLIFAAPILLSILLNIINRFDWDNNFIWKIGFGSLSGTFILTYVILWMVLPEANSDYEKMEMRGETVDVNRIRQNVKEGMGNMKERMKEWGQEVKSTAKNAGSKAKEFAGTSGKAFATEVKDTARRAGSGFGHAVGVLFKAFFLFIAGTIAFGLFVAFIALLFGGIAWWPVNNFLWTSRFQQVLAWLTLILFFIVPLIGFFTWIIRRIIKARSKTSYLGWTFGGLWALGWVVGIMFASSLVKDFRQYEHTDIPVTIVQPVNNKMVLTVSQPELVYTGGFRWMDDENSGWDLSSDTLKIAAVKFNIKASTDDQYHVTLKKYSFGKNDADASSRAEKIQYSLVSKDSILDLENGYAIGKGSKFRFQNIELEISVPAGKKLKFDESIIRKLNSFNVKVKRNFRHNRITGFDFNDEDHFQYRTGVDYIMGIDGELKGPQGTEEAKSNGDYRYENNSNDSIDLEKSIEKKRQELEQLEEKRNKPAKTISQVRKKIEGGETAPEYVSGPFSPQLTEWF